MTFEEFTTNDGSNKQVADASTNFWSDVYERTAAIVNTAKDDRVEASKNDGEKKPLTAEELEKRKEKVFADPDVKQFVTEYEKALKTGKVDENFTKAAQALGKKCLENYDTFYFMWHSMNANNVHLSVDKNGITFSRTEYLGGTDGIGHPAIPYGSKTYDLTLPFNGGKAKASSSTLLYGGPFNRDSEVVSMEKDKAAQLIFKPEEKRHRLDIDPGMRIIK